jgi:SNF2-related domain
VQGTEVLVYCVVFIRLNTLLSLLCCNISPSSVYTVYEMRQVESPYLNTVRGLETIHRVCVSDSPLVNRPSDMCSISAFLEAEPFCNAKTYKKSITDRIRENQMEGTKALHLLLENISMCRPLDLVKTEVRMPTLSCC